MVSERRDRGEPEVSRSPCLSPDQARQDAADRLVGRRTLRALQVIGVAAAIFFGVVIFVADPGVGGVDSRWLRSATTAVFVLPGIAGLVAAIVCRTPARQQVRWLPETVSNIGFLSVVMGGIGVTAAFYGAPGALAFDVLSGVALVAGLVTMVLRRRFSWKRPVQ